jgi:GNAT superfamily N-acetyltransferase
VASFEITREWFDAPGGVIPMPAGGAKIEGSHCVAILGFSDQERVFYFDNSWGEEWGNKGIGQLTYEFFDRWMFDAWIAEGIGKYPPPFATYPGIQEYGWGLPDFAGRAIHVREFYDRNMDDRMAWTFVIERGGFLDVDELFVKPQYRRQGYGSALVRSLQELASEIERPLRFWIPFADCEPPNFAVVEKMLEKAGYSLLESQTRWAAYRAEPRAKVESSRVTPPRRPALLPTPRVQPVMPARSPIAPIRVALPPDEESTPKAVNEFDGLLQQPDWKTNSDEAFRKAAKAVFLKNASLLRRLA